jgi:hypothetical protein
MAAPKGNRFWELRSSHGRNPIFANPDDLWQAACEYFEWADSTPLKEEKVFNGKDGIVRASVDKMRAMTLDGLCIFLDIGNSTWDDYRKRKDFSAVCTRIEAVIRSQKFAGAAADLLNASIIARDLGLTEKIAQDNTSSDGSMSPGGDREALDEINGRLDRLVASQGEGAGA